MAAGKLKVGTRGSMLAVAQTRLLLDEITQNRPDASFEIKTIKTSGDEGLEILGAFVKEVEVSLLKGEIDLAVHSLKDMPVALPPALQLCAIPKRGAWQDCFISRNHIPFSDLPAGSRVGTGSPRRIFQLRSLRPDLTYVPIKGNIISRMEKVTSGELDAVVLAKAGLDRVGMSDRITSVFTLSEMVPAVAQGILCIESRAGDNEATNITASIHDENTKWQAEAERHFLAAVGGGCRLPMGALATIDGDTLTITGIFFSDDGNKFVTGIEAGPSADAAHIGQRLGLRLASQLNA